MNKYIETDISDGLKQMIVGFSNLIHEIVSGNTDEYILKDIDMSETNVAEFIYRYIENINHVFYDNGAYHICIKDKDITISMEQDIKTDDIIFKREQV